MTRPPGERLMRRATFTLCALLITLSVCAGCTARYDFTECEVSADCRQLEGAGVFFECAANQCVALPAGACRVNTDCVAPARCFNGQCAGGDDMADDMAAMSCAKNSDCALLGDSYACGADDQCFDLLSPECTSLKRSADGERDDVVYLASLLPLVEPFGTSIGVPLKNAVEQAVDDFNGEGGLPDGRKIVWLSCDSGGTPAITRRAMAHLTQRVGVPAIVGPVFSENFLAAAPDAISTGTFMITPTATSPAIDNLHSGNANFTWRNIASDVFQGAGFVARVRELGATRVLVMFKGDKYGKDLSAEITGELLSELGAANLREVEYPNPVTLPDTTARRAAYGQLMTNALTGFEPDAVLIIGSSEGAEIGGAYLSVSSTMGRTIRPMIFSHGAITVLPDFIAAQPAALREAVNARVEGIAPDIFDPSTDAYARFALRYNARFGGSNPALIATTSFDATMTALFAMSGVAADEEVTGARIAGNIGRVVSSSPDATRVEFFVTTSYISTATRALREGKDININGVSGPLDYELSTGSVFQRLIGWRVVSNPQGGFTLEPERMMQFPEAPATTGMWAPFAPR